MFTFTPIIANMGPLTLGLIALLALLFFGHKLPSVARSLGSSVSEFKKGLKESQDELNRDAEAEKPALEKK